MLGHLFSTFWEDSARECSISDSEELWESDCSGMSSSSGRSLLSSYRSFIYSKLRFLTFMWVQSSRKALDVSFCM